MQPAVLPRKSRSGLPAASLIAHAEHSSSVNLRAGEPGHNHFDSCRASRRSISNVARDTSTKRAGILALTPQKPISTGHAPEQSDHIVAYCVANAHACNLQATQAHRCQSDFGRFLHKHFSLMWSKPHATCSTRREDAPYARLP